MAMLASSKMMLKRGEDQTGIHVLLSNIYADVGKWDDVAGVRMRMKELGMKKTPGASAIEVDGAVREFTSGDEDGSIASMLEEIECRLSDAGYAPDLSNVLLDIDGEEKEFLPSRHSEKLAIAHGLISCYKMEYLQSWGISSRLQKQKTDHHNT